MKVRIRLQRELDDRTKAWLARSDTPDRIRFEERGKRWDNYIDVLDYIRSFYFSEDPWVSVAGECARLIDPNYTDMYRDKHSPGKQARRIVYTLEKARKVETKKNDAKSSAVLVRALPTEHWPPPDHQRRIAGQRGGLALAAKMSPEERAESARKAVRVRWERARAARIGAAKMTPKRRRERAKKAAAARWAKKNGGADGL